MKTFTKFLLILAALALFLNAAERFDYLVRADFFAGMAGDQAAFDRAMKTCDDTLAKDPKHPEAMVWHGSGLLYASGQAFSKGDIAQGGQFFQQGLKEMNAAVALAPDNPGVLIPRGATLLTVADYVPDPAQAREFTQTGVDDYKKVLAIQKPYFETLSGHARGELLFGLAAGYDRLGEKEHARAMFEALAAVGPSSGHAEEASQWLATGSFAKKQTAK